MWGLSAGAGGRRGSQGRGTSVTPDRAGVRVRYYDAVTWAVKGNYWARAVVNEAFGANGSPRSAFHQRSTGCRQSKLRNLLRRHAADTWRQTRTWVLAEPDSIPATWPQTCARSSSRLSGFRWTRIASSRF